MDFLATPIRRRVLFAALYLSEGAPIGFIWLALPTWLRAGDVPIGQITWLTALLVIPWTFKFAWAPLVDVLQTRRWTVRHWIVAAQTIMGLTLLGLLFVDWQENFYVMAAILLVHAIAAATQDVAIDALCISVTERRERGRLNGWMQAGMLMGRSLMGGGAVILAGYIGKPSVVFVLFGVTTFSMLLVLMTKPPSTDETKRGHGAERLQQVARSIARALRHRNTWLGLLFALTGGAVFKALEVVLGPFLIDRQYTQPEVGWFAAGPMIVMMVIGSLAGGWVADRVSRKQLVCGSLLFIVVSVFLLALFDMMNGGTRSPFLLVLLATTALGIGVFTAASYALFMDITTATIAATQFSAFMGATNGCESWSSYTMGRLIESAGYPNAMLYMCAASLAALPLLLGLSSRRDANVVPPKGT